MLGTILIQSFEFFSIIGILPEERETPQRILLNLEITYSPKLPLEENIDNCINYADVCEKLQEFIQIKKFLLLETLCSASIDFLHNLYPQMQAITFSALKPDILKDVSAVGFKMEKIFKKS